MGDPLLFQIPVVVSGRFAPEIDFDDCEFIDFPKRISRFVDVTFRINVHDDFRLGKDAREIFFDCFDDIVRFFDRGVGRHVDVELGEVIDPACPRAQVVQVRDCRMLSDCLHE